MRLSFAYKQRGPLSLAALTIALVLFTFIYAPCVAYAASDELKLQSATTQNDSDATEITDVDVSLSETEYLYDAKAKKPTVTVVKDNVTLNLKTDYSVKYQNNREAGKATVTVTGAGSYSGTVTKEFTIKPANFDDCTITAYDVAFTGFTCEPYIESVKLGTGTVSPANYTVSCENVNVGEAIAIVKPVENGSVIGNPREVPFKITPANMRNVTTEALFKDTNADGSINIDYLVQKPIIGSSTYTGLAQNPDLPAFLLMVKGMKGQTRYQLSEQDYETDGWTYNTDAGEASVTLHGQGNFTGDLALKYVIEPASMEDVDISIKDQAWTGGAIEPVVSAKLGDYALEAGDYSVAYEPGDLTNVGTVIATLTGAGGNFEGSKTAAFHIRKSIEGAEVQVDDQDFSGEELRPGVVVKLGDDVLLEQDYTVAYTDNTGVGTATVTVVGDGDYMGTASGTFQIKVSAEDKAAVDAVTQAIGAIGVVTADSKAAVDAARAAYAKLNDRQKALVPAEALDALKSAEVTYEKAIEKKAAADKAAADKAKADAAAKAAALAAASTVNKPTLTAADVKKASDLGATTITLGPKVKKIAKGAFKGTNIKTIVVKTKKLKKKSVKGSLKGSTVKTVKVQVGSKKANKKVAKKYKKIFTKKNAGKKAKVR